MEKNINKDLANKVIKKINLRKLKIGIVGLGFVGLPLAIHFSQKGFNVCGYDKDQNKIKNLKKEISYISSVNKKRLKNFFKNKNTVTSNSSELFKSDAIIICLPTPLKKNSKKPDLSFIINFINKNKKKINKGHVISLESTVYPGFTELLTSKLSRKNLTIGKDFFVIHSPEREDPGRTKHPFHKIPKVCSGMTSNCLSIGKSLYSKIVDKVVIASTTRSAEITKLLENIYRSVNIGMINEFKIICDKMKINIFEIINNAATKPFGFTKFLPGPGIGGHCIPIDPYYLSWASKKSGYTPKFIKVAGEINTLIPKWIISKLFKICKKRRIKIKKVLIIGLAYKKNVNDNRSSPTYELIKILKKKKVVVDYHDPYILKMEKTRETNFNLKSINLTKYNLKSYSAAILVTDHNILDYEKIYNYSNIIFDTRNAFKNFKSNKIIIC